MSYKNREKFGVLTSKVFILIFIALTTHLTSFSADSDNISEVISENGIYADIQTTKGSIYVKLFYKKTPLTVTNFVGLAEGTLDTNKPKGSKFYDGLTFHRVIKDFMIQGGCPEGTGRGGPGYKFPDEFDESLRHDSPGVLSMANSGPGSNGSQFFITHKPTSWLDNKHSVFGKVVKGQEVVNTITQGDEIKTIKIIRNGEDAKSFKTDQEAFALRLNEINEEKKKIEEGKKKEFDQVKKQLKDAIETKSGLKYVVTQKGSGPKPEKGSVIKAHYTGMLKDGKVFDSSRNRNQAFQFRVGEGLVIKGWDEALLDMQKGERRLLEIPDKLAYGDRGAPPVIPPNSTLIFDVELVDIK